jgi:hypothetical protein
MVTISVIISYVIDIKLVALTDENKIYAQKLKGIESKICFPFP